MEAVLKDQKQMINYLHKQAEDHVKTRNMLIEMNEELEKDINDKDEEIKRLKKELKEEKSKESNDIYKLSEEIAFIKNVNQDKEDTLADVVKEKQSLQEDLHHLHEEIIVLKGDIAKVRLKEDEQNLDNLA
jgi:chromosome segregation ATPase